MSERPEILVFCVFNAYCSSRELRKTITSLQRTTQQQKNDIARYKSKTEQAEQKLMKVTTYMGYSDYLHGI